MAPIQVFFSTIHLNLGIINNKTLEDVVAVVDGATLYVSGGKFPLRAKDMVKVDVQTDCLTVEAMVVDKKTSREKKITYILEGPNDANLFQKFCARLQAKVDKKSQFASFLESSAKKGLGSRGRTKQQPKPRGVFGRNKPRVSSVSRRINDRVFQDTFSDDEEHVVKPTPTPPPAPPALEEEEVASSEELEVEKEPDEDKPPSRLRKKSKVKTLDDDDSSDDEDLFLSKSLTTPAAQRVVSPSATTQTKKEEPKAQPTISSFFQPKPTKKTAAPDKAPFSPGLRQMSPGTPNRRPQSEGSARLIRAALRQDTKWLSTSPARISSDQKRRQHLRLQRSPLEVLADDSIHDDDEDPIQNDDESLTASPLRLTLSHPPLRKRARTNYGATRRPLSWMAPQRVLDKHPAQNLAKSSEDDCDEPAKPVSMFRGLLNLGNTCYANASLQMLYSARSFVSRLPGQGGRLTRSVATVSAQLADTTPPLTAINPQELKDAMDKKTDKFHGFQQRDAHEYLNDLVDHMHEELEEKRRNSGDPYSKETLPTDDFRLTVQVCLKCNSCGYSRTKEEMYRNLSVDIVNSDKEGMPSEASVEQSLTHFFQPEEREIKCEKCADGTHASQTMRILQRPKFLILHLKRFIFVEQPVQRPSENQPPNSPPQVEYVFRKNRDPVDLSKSLTLAPFLAEDQASQPSRYALQALVHHHGARASSGHYTADGLRPNPHPKENEGADDPQDAYQWVTFDDTASAITSLDTICAKKSKKMTAYMLLYALDQDRADI